MNRPRKHDANDHRSGGRFCRVMLACGVGWWSSAALAVTPRPATDAGYADAETNVFLDDEITFVDVSMAPGDLADLLADPYQDVYKPCTVHVQNSQIDEMISSVGIRVRGNTSRSAIKKSWKLSFNEFEPGRRFHGLKKFNLNGEHNDVAIARSKLGWDLYEQMGVPAPRAAHVYLTINDGLEVSGVHVNVEQIDDDFVENWFGSDDGNLYKCLYQGARADLRYVAPGTPETYQTLGFTGTSQTYELKTNEETPDYAQLAGFIDFVNHSSDQDFAAQIADRFSVDNFLRAMAVDVVNGHWDNYWYGANNYYLYENPDTGRIEYIPYDLDNTYGVDFFGVDWANRGWANWGSGGFGSDNGSVPPLVTRILAIPAYEQQYRRYLRQLVGAVGSAADPSQSYGDTVGDTFVSATDPHFDIVSVTVSNNADNLVIAVEVAGPIDVGGDTDAGRFVVFFDTGPGGGLDNPWGREIIASAPAEYFLGGWTDGGGGFLFYAWNAGDTDWDQLYASFADSGGISVDLSEKADGIVRYTIPLARLDLATLDSFDFDVVSTNDRGAPIEPGIDHLSNPAQATPDYDTPSIAGDYVTYTVQPVTPPAAVDGPFTLGARESAIDAIQTRLTPYAFMGSYFGAMDWGFDHSEFLTAYTAPPTYVSSGPRNWGVKPYIAARTASLRATVPAPPDLPAIRVNEVLAFNCTTGPDEHGDYDDWVELYNAGDAAIDLGGMHLSDDPGEPRKWTIPAGVSVAAHGFVRFWCDEEPGEGPLHADFKLSVGGEGVALFDTDSNGAVLIDYLSYPTLAGDVGFGRYPDGDAHVEVLTALTPGGPNDNTGGPPPTPGPTPKLFINEWMADNDNTIEDPDDPGAFEDYFEIYNAEDVPVDLGGMHLTDDLGDPTQFEIPAGVVIPPRGYLVFWADDDPSQGPTHTNFKLSKSGEAIGLYGSRADCLAEIDTVTFGPQTTDVSAGRYADGAVCQRILAVPSPGASNVVLPGDTDDDGDVDADDYVRFAACFAGPGAEIAPACDPCVDVDLDDDGDADLVDFAILQAGG